MSDQSQGINLDFGGTEAIVGSVPVPDGVYVFRVDDASIVETKDKRNNMVKVLSRVDVPENHDLAKYNGRGVIDNWFLPNPATQEPAALETTKGYLRGKLEAVTGQDWGQDGMRLVPRELVGYKYKALVVKVDNGHGPQNEVRRYMRLNDDDEPLGLHAPAVQRQPRAASNGGTAAPAGSDTGPGRFRI